MQETITALAVAGYGLLAVLPQAGVAQTYSLMGFLGQMMRLPLRDGWVYALPPFLLGLLMDKGSGGTSATVAVSFCVSLLILSVFLGINLRLPYHGLVWRFLAALKPANAERLEEYDGLMWSKFMRRHSWLLNSRDSRAPEHGFAMDEPMPFGQKPYRKRSAESLRSDACSPDPLVRRRTAKHPHTPVEVLEALMKDNEPRVRAGVAMNLECPPGLLAVLATDSNPEVRGWVARNAHTPKAALDDLVVDPDETVRRFLTHNKALSGYDDISVALSKDPSQQNRADLIEYQPDLPAEALQNIAATPLWRDPKTVDAANRRLNKAE